MIRMTRIDDSKNMARFYALTVTPTLFGDWTLVTEWGRIGQGGTVKTERFAAQDAAVHALEKRQRQKQRRGYA